jgi:hypothetical protein
LPSQAPEEIASPIVKRYDELISTPSSASERKRRREHLADQELLKSASKVQSASDASGGFPNQQNSDIYSGAAAFSGHHLHGGSSGSASHAFRPSSEAGAQSSRSAFSSPQLNQLFASPERVRKLSDEEKRYLHILFEDSEAS